MAQRASTFISFLVLLAFLASALPAQADEPIRPDLWGTDGLVSATLVSGNTLYIGGDFDYVGPNTGPGVPLDSGSGSPLATYPKVVAGFASSEVDVVVPDGSGGWYIGGSFSHVGGLARNNIAHILPDYTVDPAWDPNADDGVFALAVSGGTVYAGAGSPPSAGRGATTSPPWTPARGWPRPGTPAPAAPSLPWR